MLTPEQIFDQCWLFIRSDLGRGEFETWVYETTELESSFSEDLYMGLISTNYTSDESVFSLKIALKNELKGMINRECECHTLPNLADVCMGHHDPIFKSLDQKVKFGPPLWWLWLAQCSVCQQYWMIGSEERINDVHIMKRLLASTAVEIHKHNKWPDDFKEYSALLDIGRDRGHACGFVYPVSDAMVQTVIDLAKVKPKIQLNEICRLLQVDRKQAEAIIDIAEKKAGILIAK